LRPDIVIKTLALLDEQKAIQAATLESGRPPAGKKPVDALPPIIQILYPQNSLAVTSPVVHLKYRLYSHSGEPIQQILARSENNVLGPFDPPALNGAGEATGSVNLIVPQRDSELLLFATNNFGTSVPAKIALKWQGPDISSSQKHKVVVLAVGISAYASPNLLKLKYADKDAEDFVAALNRQKGGAYTQVVPKILQNQNAKLKDIRADLAWLVNNTGKQDIGILFLAGHGFDDANGYYYVPHDVEPNNLSKTGISYRELLATLAKISGYPILFIDTCHAADALGPTAKLSIDIAGLVNRARKMPKGIIVYASSTGEQESLESPLWRNGAFTKAIVEGLDGGAQFFHRDYITSSMLDVFIKETVPDLTGHRQQPTASIPLGVPDLWMARTQH